MRKMITSEIVNFVEGCRDSENIHTEFGTPLVGFADARCHEIQSLPSLICPDHVLPQDVLADASVIISYYVPFTPQLAAGNSAPACSDAAGAAFAGAASPGWARGYEELNALFTRLNARIIQLVESLGYKAAVPDAASSFDRNSLVSSWSQRHIAHAAGLGTFGINNMLITESGCCGRFNSIVTNLPVTDTAVSKSASGILPDRPIEDELCLYKKNGTCGACIRKCPSGALSFENSGDPDVSPQDVFTHVVFSRDRCYATCLKNAEIYPAGCFGIEQFPESGIISYAGSGGSEVCGKCVTGAACAFRQKHR